VADVVEYLSDLRAFLKVVETRNFSGAAGLLGLSQSAVSKRISRLEESLGVPLLIRSTRHLSLTDAGTKFYAHAERIVAAIDEAQRSAAAAHADIGGHIRVHSTLGIGQTIVAPAIAAFIRAHQDVSVELVLSPNNSINLIQQNVDITIRLSNEREALLHHTSVDHEVIGAVRYLVCGAPAYFAAAGRPDKPQDLAQHNCLILSAQAAADAWEFLGPKGLYAVRVAGNFTSNSGAALYHALIQGTGIARMLEPAILDELNDGRLTEIFTDLALPERFILAYYPHVAVMPPRSRLFLDFLKAHLAQTLGRRPPRE
jgi:DNA-binding transcriptional LysR family regulator